MSIITNLCKQRQFRQSIADYRGNLYRIAYSWCHNPALADDLVQETLAKALKNSSQLRDDKTLKAWLYRIMNNCWHDHFRRNRETVDIDDIVLVERETPDIRHARMQIIDQVRDAVARLAVGQRQVLTLVDLEGCSYIEVAQALEIPIGTVMSRLSRARKALRQQLLDEREIEINENKTPHLRTVS